MSLGEIARGPRTIDLTADEAARGRIARFLDLAELSRLEAEVTASPWFDGVRVEGAWKADLVQTCGVTLEPLPSSLSGSFEVRAVPEGSPQAPSASAELALDPDSPDPPDVLEGETFDLAAYVLEDLSLSIDPFPRKPGAVFEQPEEPGEISPFAVLRKLKE